MSKVEQYLIDGGNPLVGEVEICGAKNAALGILAASLMTDDTVTVENLPDVSDTNVLIQAMESIGAVVDRKDRHTVKINAGSINSLVVESNYIKKIRASYYMLGALLGKYKNASVALPGGCNIGSRPIDQHTKGFKALGANVRISHGRISVETQKLTGTHIYLDVVTVGATINIMMAAVLSEGKTTIENAAKEPHVVDVANFLNSMGANMKGAGTDIIRIKGVEKLHGTTYSIIPDQIEAGTFMFAAAITKGDIMIRNVIPKHLESIINVMEKIGVKIEQFDDAVRVSVDGPLVKTNIKTRPHPGFPTDMQPQISALLCLAEGTSIIKEEVSEQRFQYVDELRRMGADIQVDGKVAVVAGTGHLTGAPVKACDLRAGAALMIAGLAASGVTTIEDIYHIERGYADMEGKLRALGACIEKKKAFQEAVQHDEHDEHDAHVEIARQDAV